MTHEALTLIEQIEALVSAPPATARRSELPQLERTLTDGYAGSLALEGERLRLERRIAELAGEDGDATAKSEELATLAQRVAAAERDHLRLRAVLTQLRGRAEAARTAGARGLISRARR